MSPTIGIRRRKIRQAVPDALGNAPAISLFALVATLLLATQADADVRQPGQIVAKRYIVESERLWAESSGHTATVSVERIIADDFIGVGPTGHRYDKADILAEIRKIPNDFVSGHLDEVNVRFFDNAAVAQGSESWVHRNGVRGRFVWTDTWVRRRGKWQIVAAEDVNPPRNDGRHAHIRETRRLRPARDASCPVAADVPRIQATPLRSSRQPLVGPRAQGNRGNTHGITTRVSRNNEGRKNERLT